MLCIALLTFPKYRFVTNSQHITNLLIMTFEVFLQDLMTDGDIRKYNDRPNKNGGSGYVGGSILGCCLIEGCRYFP
jgi:hypothetical protein